MANTIVAGNGTNNGLAVTSDNTGALNILTGSGAGTAAISIDSSQNVSVSGNVTITGSISATGGVTGSLKSATAQASTSGTSIDFTGIPTGVKRITVMFAGVSTNGSSIVQLQIGAGSVTTSGYVGGANVFTGAGVGTNTFTSGFVTEGTSGGITSATVRHGLVTLDLVTGNTWVASGVLQHTGTTTAGSTAGTLALGGTLDRVRITTVNGTDTFDAGSINIIYE